MFKFYSCENSFMVYKWYSLFSKNWNRKHIYSIFYLRLKRMNWYSSNTDSALPLLLAFVICCNDFYGIFKRKYLKVWYLRGVTFLCPRLLVLMFCWCELQCLYAIYYYYIAIINCQLLVIRKLCSRSRKNRKYLVVK